MNAAKPQAEPISLSHLLGRFGGLEVTRKMPKKRASTETDLAGLIAQSTPQAPEDVHGQKLGAASSGTGGLDTCLRPHAMTEQHRTEAQVLSEK